MLTGPVLFEACRQQLRNFHLHCSMRTMCLLVNNMVLIAYLLHVKQVVTYTNAGSREYERLARNRSQLVLFMCRHCPLWSNSSRVQLHTLCHRNKFKAPTKQASEIRKQRLHSVHDLMFHGTLQSTVDAYRCS